MKDQIEERSSQLLRNLSGAEKKGCMKKIQACTGIAEVMGSNPVQAWIFFFRLSFRNCLSCVVTARIFLLFDFIRSSKYMFHLFTFIFSSLTGILRTHNMTNSQLVEHRHRHRRDHGFESRSRLHFFQAFFSQLPKFGSNCEDLLIFYSVCLSARSFETLKP